MTTAINEITQNGRTVSKEDQISASDRRAAEQRVRQLRGARRAAVGGCGRRRDPDLRRAAGGSEGSRSGRHEQTLTGPGRRSADAAFRR